jgi:DNA-binding response OmpR family regulator
MLEVSPAAIKKWIQQGKLAAFRTDVLLLDLSMPGMDGFEVCRQIKRDPVIRDTKVVVMGADGFLSKPFAVDAVRGLLARLFGPRR